MYICISQLIRIKQHPFSGSEHVQTDFAYGTRLTVRAILAIPARGEPVSRLVTDACGSAKGHIR